MAAPRPDLRLEEFWVGRWKERIWPVLVLNRDLGFLSGGHQHGRNSNTREGQQTHKNEEQLFHRVLQTSF